MTGPKRSLRQAINDKCRECLYDPFSGAGTWRQQVETCTVQSCPLWPHRPVSGANRPETQRDCEDVREGN